MKRINCIKILAACMLTCAFILMMSACKKNKFEGAWTGTKNQGPEYAALIIEDNSHFHLTIYPSQPEGIPAAYMGDETCYYGEWESMSENVLRLTSTKRIEREDSNDNEFIDSQTFFLRHDGALCCGNQNFRSPDFSLMKMK